MTLPNGQPDPFAGGTKTPSVSFKDLPPGTTYVLEVTEYPELAQSREFGTDKLKTWPDGNPVMSAVVKGTVKSGPQGVGEVRALWAQKPSALFRAVQEAQDAAGIQVGPGVTLSVTYTHDEPAKVGNPAKQYRVTLTPPNAFAAPAQAPAAVPAAQQYVAPQAAPAQPAVVTPTVSQTVAAPVARPVLPAATLAAMAAAGLDISGFDSAG